MITQAKTKIVCTIGPASWDKKVLTKMHASGMDVARINGAFADVEELKRVENLIRSISKDIALMLDIKGHEVRLNKFPQSLFVNVGDEVTLGTDKNDGIYPATYPNLYKDIKPGQKIMVDKGATGLEVTKITNSGKIHTKVLFGEKIAPGKGMNFPGAKLSNAALTDIDKEQIAYAKDAGWEFVSASFIRNVKDIKSVREVLSGSRMMLIAKIEDQQGVDNIDDIIKGADGIMIARGDLGSELPLEKLPMLQKTIIKKCNQVGKPVILATNLLESMTMNIFPTRAEVTDVANGVLEGTDALMTSAETAQGRNPIDSIRMLERIAKETEQYLEPLLLHDEKSDQVELLTMTSKAIQAAATENNNLKVIVISETGDEVRALARMNLPQHVIAFVPDQLTRNQLMLSKGVLSVVANFSDVSKQTIAKKLVSSAIDRNLITKNDYILVTGRLPHSKDSTLIFVYQQAKSLL